MPSRGNSAGRIALLVGASALALWPAVAQRGGDRTPESILPPGFGQPEPAPDAPPTPPRPNEPGSASDVPEVALTPPTPNNTADATDMADAAGNEALTVDIAPDQLPAAARRSLDRVGLIDLPDGGFGETAFGSLDGRFLTSLMQEMKAPIASRWVSILLRRVLLSPTAIPADADGADWVAERAWLLIRMGEADMARALVARVDADNYTPRLGAIAMQAALATGDPAVVCPTVDAAAATSDEPAWPLAQAMCAGLSGEGGTASALVDRVRDRGLARGIDVLLAEKVIGSGSNTRRAVTIQWDGVDRLTAWRYGLATATGVQVPASLYPTAGPQVQAWLARAPLIPVAARANAAERAAVLGVFSAAALVDFQSALWDATDPAERTGTTAELLRAAYRRDDDAARMAALRSIWGAAAIDPYARLLLTAHAAAQVGVGNYDPADYDALVAAMFTAGFDAQAARWRDRVTTGSLGWALLAVGAPQPLATVNVQSVENVDGNTDQRRRSFLLAGLAGLGRLSSGDADALAQRLNIPLSRTTSWTRALDRAVVARARGAVVLIAAAGLQTGDWRRVPPAHLFHIVQALRRVGLDHEARLIATEAVARCE